jgi:pimeloyl-ACP methyl ester carboxylesterase
MMFDFEGINEMKTFVKSIKRMLLIVLMGVLGIILTLVCILLVYSSGKMEQCRDPTGQPIPGSLAEKIYVNINGVDQGMFIKSKDVTHPIMLFLHGGIPVYYLTKKYPTGLENHFTMVWWEQRGSGLSYSSQIPPESITLEQIISDTREVTKYLQKRFGQEKIYLMAHSGGTFIGIQVAAQAPELFHAYIGVGQMSNQLKSERLAYDYMLKEFRAMGNKKMVIKLEGVPITHSEGISAYYLSLRDGAMHTLGIGTTRSMNSVFKDIFLPSLTSQEFTLTEKINTWRGKSRSGVSWLWNTMLSTDMKKEVPVINIPVYFIHGIYDYTVSYDLAKDYFEHLKAPIKGFYTFQQSAHSPFLEEPQRMQEIFQEDILTRKINLADKK